jgi:hypothetical protein
MLTSIILLLALLISPAWAVNRNDVREFLAGRFTLSVQERLIDAVNRNNNASSWLVDHEGVVYSLCALNVQKDKSQAMQNSLNLAAQRQSSVRAALKLALYLDNGKTNTKDYPDKEALNHVILNHYESRIRFSSASKIINGTAFAIVWSEKKTAELPDNELNDRYCTYLYEQALDYYSSGKFNEAMNSFRRIRYRSWGNREAYITASLFMSRMNQMNDAANLATEFMNVYSNDITADEIALVGKILFTAGRKDEGFNAMERAYHMLSTQ